MTSHLHSEQFFTRHIGPNAQETEEMLRMMNLTSTEQLTNEIIPPSIRLPHPLALHAPPNEHEFLRFLRTIATENIVAKSYIGTGYYDCITPTVILRNILENPGWYTQYTPYQAEIAQGRLESLLNFQTMIIDLTKMELANASLLDEATAAAEAMHLMYAARTKEALANNANVLVVSDSCFPQTLDVLKTRAEPLDIEILITDHRHFDWTIGKHVNRVFGAIVQYPAQDGEVYSYRDFCETAHANNAFVAVAADIMALLLLTPPGEFGADITFGSTQRFGVPLGYGGPHAAYFASKEQFKRLMPGRIIGVSVDAAGNTAYRMALQTREQHIKRDKATSNICTAQALLANISAMYAVYHGPAGLHDIARRIHGLTCLLAVELEQLGYAIVNQYTFDTLTIGLNNLGVEQKIRVKALAEHINFRYFSDEPHNTLNNNGSFKAYLGISLDETTTQSDVHKIVDCFATALGKGVADASPDAFHTPSRQRYPEELYRTSSYLQHPVFLRYHSEHELLRYVKRLENKDLSLTHSMIPLGSCTMKLNATTEMIPITWQEFSAIHPFAPKEQTLGYQKIFDFLEKALCTITGFAACSLQPNAGAQGEYAGLMVIRAYHRSRGNANRTIVLIPSSAHGTNPASAVMAGMSVVVVKCDENGNVDFADIREKAEHYKDNLAALMITYPSTHGVFEESVQEMCALIHKHGGQVYMDGANMNAQVGLTSPAMIGADVCHLNLHKTFCIPHGGGGPGMGPICVAQHLSPFLPGHPIVNTGGAQAINAISAAPFGSASILLISYAYIYLMGGEGLTRATTYAMLNANYIKTRLESHFPVLYQGAHGRVAHELIFDMREFKRLAGVEVEDLAKRLMDYGFHAPTVSFPVPGTLMIEPTESESLEELNRFCEAMIQIRAEIQEIIDGKADGKDNVFKNAPHTALAVTADEWNHSYSRQKAAYPLPWVRERKFWPPVSRVDNTYGDRNLVCICPPMENYE